MYFSWPCVQLIADDCPTLDSASYEDAFSSAENAFNTFNLHLQS